jgi:hypothetical protein
VTPSRSAISAQEQSWSRIGDGLGEALLGFGDEAGEEVQAGGGVAVPAHAAEVGEGVDGLVEDGLGGLVDGGREVVVTAGFPHLRGGPYI